MIGEARVQRYNVSLPPEIAEKLRKAGGGNLSAGVRLAAKSLCAAVKIPVE
jgi:hypothetical protein